MNDNESSKVLAVFNNEVEAQIVAGMLNANGITAGVLGDNTASTLLKGVGGLCEWRVVVLESDFEEAEALLNTPIEEETDEEDDAEE